MASSNERLADLVGDVFFTDARVTEVIHCAPGFAYVSLGAETFYGRTWTPGAKLQLRLQHGVIRLRTYTPIRWDSDRGVTDLIAFTHGQGPAATWFSQVAVGQTCAVFGPRRSIDLSHLPHPVLFVGDESSVALACALRTTGSPARHVFEADDPAGLASMLTGLSFTEDFSVAPKTDDRKLLMHNVLEASQAYMSPFDLIVTGNAETVHAVRRAARLWPNRPRQVMGKAYWATGRTGLD